LQLVDMQVEHNAAVVALRAPTNHENLTDTLQTGTWEQTRARLRQLLDGEEFSRIANYYRDAQGLH
jgi:uncharacterized cupin superfamily protein